MNFFLGIAMMYAMVFEPFLPPYIQYEYTEDVISDKSACVFESTLEVFINPITRHVERTEFWIDVSTEYQKAYACFGSLILREFDVSTGSKGKETRPGIYKIDSLYKSYPMWGYDAKGNLEYHIPDVPFTMFFFHDFAIHGAYWHNDFGTPVSHGCVNMRVEDAEWIFNLAKRWHTVIRIRE